jgi:tripartite-type tricarboxylate transporter receptor subunit TctC
MLVDLPRRHCWIATAACLAGLGRAASASTYPSRAVSLVVPNAAGGAADQLARSMAEELGQRLGQTVVVHNRGGASGAIAAQHVLHARPDGYILLFGTTSDMVVTPISTGAARYSPRDFTAIARLGATPMTLVARPGIRVSSPDNLAARARRSPGALSIGTTGGVSLQALAAVAIQRAAGIELLSVPYGGGAPMLQDMLGGRLDLGVLALPAVLDHVRDGRLTLVGLLANGRVATAPDLPTVNESRAFDGVSVEIWAGLAGPPGLPPEIVHRLSTAVRAVLADEAYTARRARLGDVAVPFEPPAAFARFLDREADRYRRLAAGLQPR